MDSENVNKYSIQDYSLVNSYVAKTKEEQNLQSAGAAFAHFSLGLILDLQDDEIVDAITDTSYLMERGASAGHDRGIDAVFIDDAENPPTVHLFNFKYATSFDKTKNHFPANEIDKILSFLNQVMSKDLSAQDVNHVLFSAVEDIWRLYDSQQPRFRINMCSNGYLGIEPNEARRFKAEVAKFSNFEVRQYGMADYVICPYEER